jgi:hypothetical protein
MADLDIFTRILIVTTAIFLIWYFIKAYSGNFIGKKETDDIDEMIRKKTIQFTSTFVSEAANSNVDYYQDELKRLEIGSKEYLSLKKIIDLKHDLEWGEGATFGEIKLHFKELTRINPNSKNLHESIIFAIKNYKILDFSKLEAIILKKLLVMTLLDAALSSNFIPFTELSAIHELGPSNWGILAQYFILQDKTSLADVISKPSLLCGVDKAKLQSICQKIIDDPTPLAEIMKKFTESVTLLRVLTPIKTDDPYIILNVNKSDDQEEIKKKYKQLALSMHPDKFASLKLPPNLQKIISDNFLKIQQAFDKLTY